MTTLTQAHPTAPEPLMVRLNGRWHEPALWLYGAIVLLHWAEHLFQAYQIWVLGWPRPQALGMLGLWQPWLVSTEIMHWGYAAFMFAGLVMLRPGFLGRARFWWTVSLVIQGWHLVEHSILQLQAIVGHPFWGAKVYTSILQLWIPRPELHLFYNAIVFLPMVVAMILHMYPPADERHLTGTCSCARVPAAPKAKAAAG
ncbi:hypothetical protein DCC79_03885 [bacterium]|nr:hypothetical protein [Chloroflexi bacterium CFX6]RIL11725.1 MAG: hypothetical protein DCC79_03885 [bacterium]